MLNPVSSRFSIDCLDLETHYAWEIIDYDEHHCVSIVRKRENPACPAQLVT